MLRKQGVQAQILLIIVMALLLLTAALQFAHTIQQRDTLIRSTRQQSLAAADSLRETIYAIQTLVARMPDLLGTETTVSEDRLLAAMLDISEQGFSSLASSDENLDFAALVLPDGAIWVHSDPAYKGQQAAGLSLAGVPLDETVRRTVPGFGPVYLTRVTLEPTASLRMDLVLGRPAGPIDAELRQSVLSSFLIALGAVVLVGVIAAILVRRSVTQPIRAVIAGARHFSQGRLDHQIAAQGSQELHDLAQTLNQMAHDLHESRAQLEEMYRDLETRMLDRTRDLEMSSAIGRIATAQRDVDALLRETVEQICRRFEAIYHAQVFLLDDLGEYAVLVASTGDAGRGLLAFGHKLAVGSESVIGRVTAWNQTAIASDTLRGDVAWQPNPLLPDTRAEMALPLSIEGRVIGALDVQSTRPDVFTDDMVRVFEVLADQLAIAIENARLLAESERRIREIDGLNRQLTQTVWQDYLADWRADLPRGYVYDQQQVATLDEDDERLLPHRTEAPIQVRGETIGALVAALPAGQELSENDRMLIEAIAHRVALAVENARLFEETQHALAETEQLYEAARAVSSASDLTTIYQLVAEQLSAIGPVDVFEVLIAGPDPALAQYLENVYAWSRRDFAAQPTTRERLRLLPLSDSSSSLLPTLSPVVYAEVSRDVLPDHPLYAKLNSPNVRSAALIPLNAGGRWFGLLVCGSQRPGGFQPAFVTFASALADQLAIAHENRRLFDEAQTEARRARALAEAGQLASQIGVDYEAGLHNLFQAVSGPGHYDRWWFGRLSNDSARLIVVAASDPALPETIDVQHDRYALAEAARIGEFVVVNDPTDHPAIDGQDPAALRAWGKHIAMPVRIGTNLVGVLLIGRDLDESNLDERDIQLVATLASQVAVATENRRLFDQVESQWRNLQTIVDTMPTGILVMDRLGAIMLSNQSLLDLLGPEMQPGTPERPVPYPIVRAGTPDAYPRQDWPLSRVFDTGDPVLVDDMTVLHPDGTEIHLLASAAPILDEQGQITAVVGAFQDITDMHDLEHALQDSLRETTLLYEASRFITDAQTPADVLRAFVDFVAPPSTHHAALYLLLGDSTETHYAAIEVAATWGENPAGDLTGMRYAADMFPLWDSLLAERTMYVDDVAQATGLDDRVRRVLSTFGMQAAALIPLNATGRPLGGILIGQPTPWAHTENTQRMYQALADQAAISLENTRLYQQAQRRARQLATAAEISRAIASILQMDTLFTQVVNLIRDSFGYDHVQIFMLSSDSTQANVVASTGEAGEKMIAAGHSLPVGSRSVIGQVTATGQPQIAMDTADARAVFKPNPHLPNTRSEMALPLIARRQILGALDVQSNQPGSFTEEDTRVLASLADLVATAIDNARLFELSEQHAEDMSFLFKVTTAATTSPDLDEALTQAVEALRLAMRVSSASIFLPDESGQFMLRGANVGTPGLEAELSSIAIDRGLVGWIARHREAVIIGDVTQDPRRLPTTAATRSVIAVPLMTAGDLIGVLVVESEALNAFDNTDLRLLQTLSGSLAAIIQNSRLLREVQVANEQLLEVDRLKTNFLAAMSHELRTPLNSIIGFSRVILKGIDGPLTETQEQDLTTIYESGKHLLGLVNDILDQAKIEAGKMELSFGYFKLQDVITGVMSTAVGLTRDKGLRLVTEIADDLPDAYGDEFRTRQILLNLVSNASKFTHEGSITVSTFPIFEDGRSFIQVSVTDTGIGIAEKDMGLLFEAFQQVDNSTTRASEGTGMGLPLAKSLTELQGGRIGVISEPGKGSTFSVTIPTTPPDESPENKQPGTGVAEQIAELVQERAPVPVDERIILVVEDSVEVISLYRRYLSREGYEVLGSTHPEEVEELVAAYHPCVVLLDVNMPGRDGWDVLAHLKANPCTSDTPVIVCSINPDSERGLSLGAAAYLVKPFAEDRLLDAIRQTEIESNRPRILIVDDKPESVRAFRDALCVAGQYVVLEAISGQQALGMIRALRRLDLVILDLRMPEIDGFEVLHALRSEERTAQVPVLVLTAEDISADERAALDSLDVYRKDALDEAHLLDRVADRLGTESGNE